MGIFDLLELAGEASGKEAVAKVAKEVVPRSLSKDEKKQLYERKKREQQMLKDGKHPQQQPQQDACEGQEYSGEGGGHGGGQGPAGGQQVPVYAGGMGRPNGRILVDADGNQYRDYSRGGDNGNTGYRGNFNGNGGRGRGNFNANRGGRGYGNGGVGRGYGNGGYSNGNRGYDNNGYNNNGYSNGNGAENQVYHEGNGQYQQDGNNYSNGERQGYSRGDGKRRMEYRPKSKPSSVAASDADQKSEGKAEPVAEEVPQKEATAENADAVPASESENSAGDAAKDDSKKVEGEGAPAQTARKKERDPNVKLLSGSAKRKLKKKNPKKEDSNDGDASKKAADNVPEAIEEEKQEMTLEEYEKMLGKKKALVPSEPVERKIDPAFEGQKPLEKKKLEDERLENAQRKPKEVAAKEGKARKITIQQYLKPADGTEYVPPLPPPRPQSGGYRGGRGDGAYNGRSRDSSSESRVYNSGNGNPPIVFRNVDATNGNGAPRRDGYQQRTEGGYQQGGYNGARANQQGGGRVNGGYQERQDGYSGERRQGPYQQGGNNQERRQGPYQQGGNQERRQGPYQQGGNQERRQGAYNGGGYQQGGGRRYQRPTPVPEVNSAVQFPALGAALPAGSKAKEPSPSQSQA